MKRGLMLFLLSGILASGCDVVKVQHPDQPRIQRLEPTNLGFEEGDLGNKALTSETAADKLPGGRSTRTTWDRCLQARP